ncbi:MAG: hypothetical protein K6G81_01690 [Lachnospiraceae bacterium]|nr:hypothetical protein [Lachnospiraceae bacterium]
MDFSQIQAFSSECVSAPDTFFSLGNDCLVIRKFSPSRLDTGDLVLAQDRMPSGEAVFYFETSYYGDLALMISADDLCNTIPGDISVTVGGFEYECAVNHGYLLISGPFESGCRIILTNAPADTYTAPETSQEVHSEADIAAETLLVSDAAAETLSEPETPAETLPETDIAAETLSEPETPTETLPEADAEAEILSEPETPADTRPDFDALVAGTYAVGELIDEAAADTLHNSGFEEASVFYNSSKKRYLLKIHNSNGAHAILPDGTEISAAAGKSAFTGYRMETDDGEFDLVIMKESALKDDTRRCNAYMDVLGSFLGDCCYQIDTVHEVTGTHGHTPGSAMIDRDTGYKWGCSSPSSYEFELENGLYTVETVKGYADGMTVSDRDAQKVSNGYLRLFGNDYVSIKITAADTISENNRYVELEPAKSPRYAARIFIPDACPIPILAAQTSAADLSGQAVPSSGFRAPNFEHIDGAQTVSGVTTGLKKDAALADNYDFVPLSGDRVVAFTPIEPDDDEADIPRRPLSSGSGKDAVRKPLSSDNGEEAVRKPLPSDSEQEAVKNITVSVYKPEQTGITAEEETDSPVAKAARQASAKASEVSKHISNTLAKRKVDTGALVAGIAAGTVAVITGLVRIISKKKRR